MLPVSVDSDMPPQLIDADVRTNKDGLVNSGSYDKPIITDTDTNKDDLVSKGSFSKLVDMAASIPRMYGYVQD